MFRHLLSAVRTGIQLHSQRYFPAAIGISLRTAISEVQRQYIVHPLRDLRLIVRKILSAHCVGGAYGVSLDRLYRKIFMQLSRPAQHILIKTA